MVAVLGDGDGGGGGVAPALGWAWVDLRRTVCEWMGHEDRAGVCIRYAYEVRGRLEERGRDGRILEQEGEFRSATENIF